MECLWDFLPNFLQGFAKSLQRDGLVWPLSQPSVHFVPHMLVWWQIGGHRGPSHHQHILMSEKVHETRNVWSSIVLLKGHVPSLTTDEGQHVRSNNLLQVAVCIYIVINIDQGCPAMGWDATPHHHTPTAKRMSLSTTCILLALAHPAVHHNPTTEWSRINRDSSENCTASHSLRRHLRWVRRRSARLCGSRIVRTQGGRGRMWCSRKMLRTVLGCIRHNYGMVRVVTLAVSKRLRKCVTMMYWSCLCDVTHGRPDRGLSLSLPVVWKRPQRELIVFRCTTNRRATSRWGVPAWIIPMARWRVSVPKRGMLSARTDNDHQ